MDGRLDGRGTGCKPRPPGGVSPTAIGPYDGVKDPAIGTDSMKGSPDHALAVTAGARTIDRREVGRFRVSLAEFDGKHRISSHFHERACVSVVLHGQFVQRFGGSEYVCPPGGLLAKPPGERHDDRWCGVRTRHVILEPDPDAHSSLGPLSESVERIGYRLDPWALGLGRRIEREIVEPDDITDLALEALALELLVRLHRRSASDPPAGQPPRWLERARECLDDRYAERLRLGELAESAGVHPAQLTRHFRRYYGTTPSAYVRQLRLRAAMADLAHAHTGSLSSIAWRHGFADQSHLTRQLKRATGLTPAAYRSAATDPRTPSDTPE